MAERAAVKSLVRDQSQQVSTIFHRGWQGVGNQSQHIPFPNSEYFN